MEFNKKEKEKINFKYNLSVYFSFLKKYAWVCIAIFIVIFFIEAGHLINSFLFKIVVDRGTEFIAKTLELNAYIKILLIIVLIFIIAMLLKSGLRWVYIHLINRLDTNVIFDIKRRYFNHIIHLSHGFHTSHKTGSLISRLARAGGAAERMTDVIMMNTAPLVFQLIVLSFSVAYFSWKPALVIVIMSVVFLAFNFFIQTKQQSSRLLANDSEDREKAYIADVFTNIDSIKYFGKEKDMKNKFNDLSTNTKTAFLKNWDYFRILDAGNEIIIRLGIFFIVYFPLIDFLHGKLSLGTLVFIYTVFSNIIDPLFSFVHGIRNFYRAMADFQDLFGYGKIENDIKDKENAKNLKIKDGEVEFNKIWFGYEKRIIFQGLDLKIPKGKKIALVGHSGSGKTTLVKLLYRLHDVNSGSIKIDNEDIRNFKQESLREEMAIVPQECILFDDTIYNNILFSKLDAKRKEVLEAIRFAQLDKMIKEFPNKENTIVGERGVKLSGGEKQRVSIARAILADKKILVLDEATSSLDSETEHEIQSDLKELMKGRTAVIIAHRLSTIMNADIIVVLKKGKIVQLGNHNSLIREDGEYKKLWNLQKGGYIK